MIQLLWLCPTRSGVIFTKPKRPCVWTMSTPPISRRLSLSLSLSYLLFLFISLPPSRSPSYIKYIEIGWDNTLLIPQQANVCINAAVNRVESTEEEQQKSHSQKIYTIYVKMHSSTCIYMHTYRHAHTHMHILIGFISMSTNWHILNWIKSRIKPWQQTLTLTALNIVIYDSPWCICASLTFCSVPSTLFPLSRCRTATSRRRSTMRSGCATGPASCWPPARRKTRPSKRRRTSRPAAPASWPTCRSCRGWRRPRSCRKWRGGRRTRGRWTIGCHAKDGWPSQASKRLD